MSFSTFLLDYGLLILSVLITIVSLISYFVKAKKSGNNTGMLALLQKIPSLVTTAESLYGSGKGTAKLDYVLTQLRLYALQNGIKTDIEDLTAQINSVVETTNNVNTSKTCLPCDEQEVTDTNTDNLPNDNQNTNVN